MAALWNCAPAQRSLRFDYDLDQALTGQANQRAVQFLENPYDDKTLDHYLNPRAFGQPALGTYSPIGGMNVLVPGSVQVDMGVTRTFQVRERQSLQFRAETFNLPNHLSPGLPVTAINNPSFGKIQTAGDPRLLQFALKYVF